MSVYTVDKTDARVNELLEKAALEPLILEVEGGRDFAVLPLDDEVIDLLIERNPRFAEECRQIRDRMNRGDYLTHGELLAALDEA